MTFKWPLTRTIYAVAEFVTANARTISSDCQQTKVPLPVIRETAYHLKVKMHCLAGMTVGFLVLVFRPFLKLKDLSLEKILVVVGLKQKNVWKAYVEFGFSILNWTCT